MLSLGLDISLGVKRRSGASAGPFVSLASDGWQATVTSPVDLSMTPVPVLRQGYDGNGVATTYGETLYLTKRVRQAYPNQASFTADKVALSDYLYSTDGVTGSANNSAETSPKPKAQWIMPHGMVVGTTLRWEIVAFHRNAGAADNIGQVACVRVRTHRLMSVKGNIFPQLNTKGDVFMTDGTRLGNFVFVHGVGCEGNFTLYSAAATASEAQAYPGIGSKIGTSTTVLQDALFTNYQGTTLTPPSTYVAGAGGGTYTLQGGSTARDILSQRLTKFDFAGAARAAGTQDAGAYA